MGGMLRFSVRWGTLSMKIVNWNVRWASPRSKHSAAILNRINQHSPEVVCLTETHRGLLRDGHAISARPDYGYGIQEYRRKVLLWSREPWEHVDDIGDDRMPPGRFVSGVTRTSVGEVTVVGLCIPWRDSRAHATYSGERRKAWEDHEVYLEHLAGILSPAPSKRFVVMGDFNQQIAETSGTSSRRRYGKAAHRAVLLQRAIPPHVRLPTAGLAYCGRRSIDHIGLSADMATASLGVISNVHEEQLLSDHFGVVADVFENASGVNEEGRQMVTHRGGCHCGRVRYAFEAEPELVVTECNCSVCTKSGYLGITVPGERFRLLCGEDDLSEYTFKTGIARHRFCRHCGIKSFYVPRSHPDGISVNFRCIDEGTVRGVNRRSFDGRNWERYYPKGRAEGFPN